MNSRKRLPGWKILLLLVLPSVLLIAFYVTSASQAASSDGELKFTDARKQSQEFMGYYRSIRLTPAQQKIKEEGLKSLPAPCCDDNSALECCCPCNMAKTIWGLSHHLIAEHDYNAKQVREKVLEWVRFINPDGFSGDACYTGRCATPFAAGGCGGMSESRLVF